MKDDAIYCERPEGSDMAYIPYWRHMQLAYKDRQTARRVIIALVVLLISSNAAWLLSRL